MIDAPRSDLGNLLPGAVFHGRYQIVRPIKAGAMGAVYEVSDVATQSRRALKVMLPGAAGDADQRARFSREARVTGEIESEHMVRISDAGVDEATQSPFLVMELLRGEELGDLLNRRGALPAAEVVQVLSQVARALDKTHAAGVVHRDLKPGNLFITTRDDGSPCVKILDFGIAKVVAKGQADKTRALGTPLYMAPEQARGEGAIGPAADIYALGHVAYAALVGEPYFEEESSSGESLVPMLMKILSGADEPPTTRAHRRRGATLPAAFDAWFFQITSPAPDRRFDRASTAILALAQIYETPITAAAPPTTETPTVPKPSFAEAPTVAASAPAPAPPSDVPRTLESPPFPPAPIKPPAAAPKASPAILVAILGAGALVAAGLVVAVVLTRGNSSSGGSASAAPTSPAVGCPPNSTCAFVNVTDIAHADPLAILPAARQLAQSLDRRAALVSLSAADAVKDGSVDLGADRAIFYSFITPDGSVGVYVAKRLLIATKNKNKPFATPLPDPTCAVKSAWRAAVSAGLPATTPLTLTYYGDPIHHAVWMAATGKRTILLDAQTCALKGNK